MPSLGNRNQKSRGICWLGVIRTLIVQVLVLLALSGAVVRYLNWSSEAAWDEFIAASKASALDPKPQPQSATPVHAVRGQAPCWRA